MMEQVQIATLLYSVVLGLGVLWTYLMFLGALDTSQRAEAWAVFTNGWMFGIWCVMAFASAVGFVTFLSCYLSMTDDAHSVSFALAWVPVSLFLGFEALFSPLLYFGHRALVLAVLVGAAVSAVAMAYVAYDLFGPTHVAFVGSVVLATHCLVMDLVVWGGILVSVDTWRVILNEMLVVPCRSCFQPYKTRHLPDTYPTPEKVYFQAFFHFCFSPYSILWIYYYIYLKIIEKRGGVGWCRVCRV